MVAGETNKNKTGEAPVKLKKEQKRDRENEIQSSVECEGGTDTQYRTV